VNLKVHSEDRLLFGTQEVDLSGVSQIVSRAQLRAIGQALAVARERFIDGRRSVPEILDEVERMLEEEGLDALDDRRAGELAEFRRFELAATLNRLRTLRVAPEGKRP
jgi:ABC-type branched-subunit amino acid transport system ATPase component